MASEPFHWQPMWLQRELGKKTTHLEVFWGVFCFLGFEDRELEISFKVPMQMQTKSNSKKGFNIVSNPGSLDDCNIY